MKDTGVADIVTLSDIFDYEPWVMDMKVMVVYTLNCTIMMENKLQMLTISFHAVTTETGTLKTCNSTGFHT